MSTKKEGRDFDLVLQGATGFTGQLAARELVERAPADLTWAIAGRSRARVDALAQELGVPGLVADGLDAAATLALSKRARVVLSCAGPFARYGDFLVDACAKSKTHYADLSGEMPWLESVIQRHHEACTQSGTALVPCSGFDSVPTDIAVFALARELSASESRESVRVHGFFTIKGGLNGGTLHSGLALGEGGAFDRVPKSTKPGPSVFRIPTLRRFGAPFLMAPVNEWIAARTSALLAEEECGYEMHYTEHLSVRSRLQAHTMSGLLSLSNGLLASSAGRKLLRIFGPKPGEGPSARSIESGFARLVLLAGDLESPTRTRQWDWSGDPSNRITVRCLVQTGLALAAGEATRGGVLTPVAALRERLEERLLAIGAVTRK